MSRRSARQQDKKMTDSDDEYFPTTTTTTTKSTSKSTSKSTTKSTTKAATKSTTKTATTKKKTTTSSKAKRPPRVGKIQQVQEYLAKRDAMIDQPPQQWDDLPMDVLKEWLADELELSTQDQIAADEMEKLLHRTHTVPLSRQEALSATQSRQFEYDARQIILLQNQQRNNIGRMCANPAAAFTNSTYPSEGQKDSICNPPTHDAIQFGEYDNMDYLDVMLLNESLGIK